MCQIISSKNSDFNNKKIKIHFSEQKFKKN